MEGVTDTFLALLDAGFRTYGAEGGVPPALQEAVRTIPRHRFIHRYRLDGRLGVLDPHTGAGMADAYADLPLTHLDAADQPLDSTNSTPSYALFLLHRLRLSPGQNVLEIGSGSGWLAGLIDHMVGESGSVTGVEIIDTLAARSRADLASCGLDRVRILSGDAALLEWPPTSFDRAIITAGCWNVPAFMFSALREGGLLQAPIEAADGGGTIVCLFRRHGHRLVCDDAVPGFFVAMRGASQHRPGDPTSGAHEAGLAPSLRDFLDRRGRLSIYPASHLPDALAPGVRIEPRGPDVLVWEFPGG